MDQEVNDRSLFLDIFCHDGHGNEVLLISTRDICMCVILKPSSWIEQQRELIKVWFYRQHYVPRRWMFLFLFATWKLCKQPIQTVLSRNSIVSQRSNQGRKLGKTTGKSTVVVYIRLEFLIRWNGIKTKMYWEHSDLPSVHSLELE